MFILHCPNSITKKGTSCPCLPPWAEGGGGGDGPRCPRAADVLDYFKDFNIMYFRQGSRGLKFITVLKKLLFSLQKALAFDTLTCIFLGIDLVAPFVLYPAAYVRVQVCRVGFGKKLLKQC